MALDSAENNASRKPRGNVGKADILIHTAERPIIGRVRTLRGREATERVIARLLDREALHEQSDPPIDR